MIPVSFHFHTVQRENKSSAAFDRQASCFKDTVSRILKLRGDKGQLPLQ